MLIVNLTCFLPLFSHCQNEMKSNGVLLGSTVTSVFDPGQAFHENINKWEKPGPRFNIYSASQVWGVIFNMGIPILVRWYIYIEMVSCSQYRFMRWSAVKCYHWTNVALHWLAQTWFNFPFLSHDPSGHTPVMTFITLSLWCLKD